MEWKEGGYDRGKGGMWMEGEMERYIGWEGGGGDGEMER